MSMQELTVDEFTTLYGDPAKVIGRKRKLRGQVRRRHKAGPNKTEQTVYQACIVPLIEGGALRVFHGDEYGKIRLCRRQSYRPDWVVDLQDGKRLYIECKRRWANAKRKGESSWRTRETLVKLYWLASKVRRRGDIVWLLTVEPDGHISRLHIQP